MPKIETIDLVKIQCNLIDNRYHQGSRVLNTFVPDRSYGQLLIIKPGFLIGLKKINAEFDFTEVWFIDQNNRPLEMEDNINITLMIGSHNNRLLIYILI